MSRLRALLCLAFLPAPLLFIDASAQPAGTHGEDFIYRMQKGDTLSDLAGTYTRNPALWTRLQSINGISDAHTVPIGREIRIPLSMIPVRPAQAKVIHVSGQAQANGAPLLAGAVLKEGSTVTTADNGFVTLELADGSKLSLPANGSVEMEHLREFEGTLLQDSVIRVKRGALESTVAPKGGGVGRFEIRTPVAVTGVRGTRFRVQASEHGARSEVLEGSVRLSPKGRPDAVPVMTSVASGYGAAVGADGMLLGVRALLPAPALGEPQRAYGSWTVPFAPVPGAVRYLVQVSTDSEATQIVSARHFDTPEVRYAAPGAGTYYVSVRAIDALGLGGPDAVRSFEGASVLKSATGPGIALGSGGFVTLTDY